MIVACLYTPCPEKNDRPIPCCAIQIVFFQLLIVISNLLRYSGLRFTYVSFRHAKVVILYNVMLSHKYINRPFCGFYNTKGQCDETLHRPQRHEIPVTLHIRHCPVPRPLLYGEGDTPPHNVLHKNLTNLKSPNFWLLVFLRKTSKIRILHSQSQQKMVAFQSN